MSNFNSSTKNSCQLYVVLAIGSQNLGILNRRLFEVLWLQKIDNSVRTTCLTRAENYNYSYMWII